MKSTRIVVEILLMEYTNPDAVVLTLVGNISALYWCMKFEKFQSMNAVRNPNKTASRYYGKGKAKNDSQYHKGGKESKRFQN